MNQEKEEKGSYICEYKKQVLYLLNIEAIVVNKKV